MAFRMSLTQFQRAVSDWVMSFPKGPYQRITVDVIAAAHVFGLARFTFKCSDVRNRVC